MPCEAASLPSRAALTSSSDARRARPDQSRPGPADGEGESFGGDRGRSLPTPIVSQAPRRGWVIRLGDSAPWTASFLRVGGWVQGPARGGGVGHAEPRFTNSMRPSRAASQLTVGHTQSATGLAARTWWPGRYSILINLGSVPRDHLARELRSVAVGGLCRLPPHHRWSASVWRDRSPPRGVFRGARLPRFGPVVVVRAVAGSRAPIPVG